MLEWQSNHRGRTFLLLSHHPAFPGPGLSSSIACADPHTPQRAVLALARHLPETAPLKYPGKQAYIEDAPGLVVCNALSGFAESTLKGDVGAPCCCVRGKDVAYVGFSADKIDYVNVSCEKKEPTVPAVA